MTNREKRISFVTLWGAVANLALTAVKFIAGILGCSAAMVADAVHSLSDLVSDAIVLVMVRISAKGGDKGHDYGHGKYETLAALSVSLLLAAVAVKMMMSGVSKIKAVIYGATISSPGWIALCAAILSIVVKEILYQWTAREGRKLDSPAMIANAWHHRSDALSSVGSLIGIGGAIVLGGKWTLLDPLTGCIISIFIFIVAVRMAGPAFSELMEASLPDETEDEIISIIGSIEKVDSVHELKTRRSGHYVIIDAHIVVDPDMSVADAHEVTTAVEAALREKYGQETLISLHVEPDENAD